MALDFLELNKKKLLNLYLWVSGIFTVGFTVCLFFFFSKTPLFYLILIYSITIIIFPSFISALAIVDWFLKHKYKNKILSKKPYSELKSIGFTKKMMKKNQNGFFYYSDFAEINNCQINFDVFGEKPKIAEFKIYGTTFHLSGKEFVQKIREYRYKNIDLDVYGFTLKIDTKKEILNKHDLEKKLIELTHIAKKEKYTPISIEEIKPVGNTVYN